MSCVLQYWPNGDVLVGEVLVEQPALLPTKGDVVELPGPGYDRYPVQSVVLQLGPGGDVSLALVMVDDFWPRREQIA